MDELRKRALEVATLFVAEQSDGWGEKIEREDSEKLAAVIAAFAASEADRREREMLKAICSTLCEHCEHFADPPERDFVLIVAHDDVRWRHLYDDEDGRTVECEASIIREAYHEWTLARRLREQREKGKA